jgi:hypothetical protein
MMRFALTRDLACAFDVIAGCLFNVVDDPKLELIEFCLRESDSLEECINNSLSAAVPEGFRSNLDITNIDLPSCFVGLIVPVNLSIFVVH